MQARLLKNYVGGSWQVSAAAEHLDVINPATAETLARVPLSPPGEVDQAARVAAAAFEDWRRVPATERIQYLFKLKTLMDARLDDLSRSITLENGKTLGEARGEMRRAIENVEVACGIPILMQGDVSEDIAAGIDELMIRQPVGVVAIVAPFNFPGMIPFWFLPYAVATGNTVIVKPSERCPITMQIAFELFEEVGFPPGVLNLVNGGADTVNAILDHPVIQAVSFVGSTAVARHIYARGAANGKRVQAQGGAKNPIIILPDADLDMTTRIVADSAFGNAGQRCLAASLAITVGEVQGPFIDAITEAASSRVVGSGLDEQVTMGPVISAASKTRIQGLIQTGLAEGAELIVDGRETTVQGYENGYFLRPTILEVVSPDSTLARTEVFGPVLGCCTSTRSTRPSRWSTGGRIGNMACLFTGSGAAARKFRSEAMAGNIGNQHRGGRADGLLPFSGWKDSFFGTLHGQSRHAVEFLHPDQGDRSSAGRRNGLARSDGRVAFG
jgi:malonate-semialdehyde dehydrogenase (acetylating)/methylmalonate-semialdehyde dehydrogenase